MKAALLNLDYTVDFKNMSELRKMDYKSKHIICQTNLFIFNEG